MIDPITAMTAATSAYGLLKKGLAAGREIESMTGDLSRWMGAISDIKQAEVQSKNPPIFKKIFAGSSVEQEAMNAFATKKKAEKMEDELRTWINMTHGPNAWNDLLKMQAKIRKQRQETLYAQDEARRKLFNILGIIFLCTIVGALIMWIAYLFYLKKQGEI